MKEICVFQSFFDATTYQEIILKVLIKAFWAKPPRLGVCLDLITKLLMGFGIIKN